MGSQQQSFFFQTLLFTAFLVTVLKDLTYALVSTWSLVSSGCEHVKRKMQPWSEERKSTLWINMSSSDPKPSWKVLVLWRNKLSFKTGNNYDSVQQQPGKARQRSKHIWCMLKWYAFSWAPGGSDSSKMGLKLSSPKNLQIITQFRYLRHLVRKI